MFGIVAQGAPSAELKYAVHLNTFLYFLCFELKGGVSNRRFRNPFGVFRAGDANTCHTQMNDSRQSVEFAEFKPLDTVASNFPAEEDAAWNPFCQYLQLVSCGRGTQRQAAGQ